MVTQFHTLLHFVTLSHTATTHTDLYTHSHTHILYSKSHFWPEIHWFLYSKSFAVYDVQRGLRAALLLCKRLPYSLGFIPLPQTVPIS